MNLFFAHCFLLITLIACNNPGKIEMAKAKEDIMKTDIAFSDLSKEKGRNAAFLEYIDSTCVLLRSNSNPIVGKDAIRFYQENADTSFTLTWHPENADMASSGDLGFTYGIWTFHEKNQQPDSVNKGTYVTIWKKQKDGNWKFVLDTGSPGLSKQK
jgi:ketosteroid isomerase-like protein